ADKRTAVGQRQALIASHPPDVDVLTLSPIEFEMWCAARLVEAGWSVGMTPISGDQGIDIIAERDGVTLVLQCKLYTSPVGNRAVQEALSGKAYAGAQACVVVSNAPYTMAAKDL